ncbi:pentapeptide repeat-containing protein [Nostoc sp.]|uniref:pentapeptide repeat-containing protein n=1 Tax=Nostoc sp. TaxID=1180 RepID=UPI002FF87896
MLLRSGSAHIHRTPEALTLTLTMTVNIFVRLLITPFPDREGAVLVRSVFYAIENRYNTLPGFYFKFRDLENNFQQTNLSNAELIGANLAKANLQQVNLMGTNFNESESHQRLLI